MKINRLIIGFLSMIVSMGFGAQFSLADPEQEHSYASSSGHGCCEEMMEHHAHSADHLRHLLKHHKEIGLTEEQVKKLNAIELDFDRARIKSKAEIHIAERELLALVEDEKTDLSALESKVKESEMLEVGLRMLAFKARRDALAVLTPEQREKGKAAHEKRMQERMSGHGGGSAKGDHR
ncbi:MAG: periplasmic heavy metal sensor [Nitrospiraceae bacterium]|nr:periplasmic heavy metal sensor [Nitrospiraceae bacterium]